MTVSIELLGIGNSVVDHLCHAEDQELEKNGLIKGSMALIDQRTVAELELTVEPMSTQSGGSVANSVVHFASLGGRGAFIGKVANDASGLSYVEDMVRSGVDFGASYLDNGIATGRCYVFVTPDGQRTMRTYLGASTELTVGDVSAADIAAARVLLIEGYLWSSAGAREMILESVSIAQMNDTLVAFTLSDPNLVDSNRLELQHFVDNHVELLFGNENEINQLFGTATVRESIDRLKPIVPTLIITRGEKGSVSVADGRVVKRDATAVERVVDTTGAGDAYAGGYLYGLLRNRPVERCMDLASDLAARTICHYGGRNAIR